jgi:GTP-binding protein
MSLRVKFIKSAVVKADYPKDTRPEVAIVGRSNSGKSSLINSIAEREVAKVSQTPGKTTTLNFFNCNEDFYLVDMPGYGFAKRSPKDKMLWKEMVEGYLGHRKNLKGLLLIMDIRRKWTQEEQMLTDWAASLGRKVCVILNKMDKVKQGERVLALRAISKLDLVNAVYCTSTVDGKGIQDMLDYVYSDWIKEKT